jgi:hypothetical protein
MALEVSGKFEQIVPFETKNDAFSKFWNIGKNVIKFQFIFMKKSIFRNIKFFEQPYQTIISLNNLIGLSVS